VEEKGTGYGSGREEIRREERKKREKRNDGLLEVNKLERREIKDKKGEEGVGGNKGGERKG